MPEYSINIQHFLNKDTEPVSYQSESYYPLHIQININNEKAIIKSRLNEYLKIYQSYLEKFINKDRQFQKLVNAGYFSEKTLKNINNEQIFPVYNLLNDEVYMVSKLIDYYMSKKHGDFNVQDLENKYIKFTLEISDICDNHIKNQYIEEVKHLFLQFIDKEKEKVLFNISNYLIHFINWNNSFYNFYDTTFDLFPGALKKIENRFSRELRNNIKAYMAFYNNINQLRRHFEKRESGKISTLGYIDWQTDIKDILTKQFATYFGSRKAKEYVTCLDNIITKAIDEG